MRFKNIIKISNMFKEVAMEQVKIIRESKGISQIELAKKNRCFTKHNFTMGE